MGCSVQQAERGTLSHLRPLTSVIYMSKLWYLLGHGDKETKRERSDLVAVQGREGTVPRRGSEAKRVKRLLPISPRLEFRLESALIGWGHPRDRSPPRNELRSWETAICRSPLHYVPSRKTLWVQKSEAQVLCLKRKVLRSERLKPWRTNLSSPCQNSKTKRAKAGVLRRKEGERERVMS